MQRWMTRGLKLQSLSRQQIAIRGRRTEPYVSARLGMALIVSNESWSDSTMSMVRAYRSTCTTYVDISDQEEDVDDQEQSMFAGSCRYLPFRWSISC